LTVYSEQLGDHLRWGGTAYDAADGPRGDRLFCHRQSGGTAFKGDHLQYSEAFGYSLVN